RGGLSPRLLGGPLSRARGVRPRRLARHDQGAGESDGLLALDRRPRADPRRRAGHRPRAAARARARARGGARGGVSGRAPLLRWAIPLAVVPVLVLLAYGFRTDPREIPSPLVGRPASPFALTAFDGKPVALEALRGHVVVVNFWASWCYPACYEEAPSLERAW